MLSLCSCVIIYVHTLLRNCKVNDEKPSLFIARKALSHFVSSCLIQSTTFLLILTILANLLVNNTHSSPKTFPTCWAFLQTLLSKMRLVSTNYSMPWNFTSLPWSLTTAQILKVTKSTLKKLIFWVWNKIFLSVKDVAHPQQSSLRSFKEPVPKILRKNQIQWGESLLMIFGPTFILLSSCSVLFPFSIHK